MAKTGPKRKTGVGRYPGGQIRHSDREAKESPSMVALEARMRQILGVAAWEAARASPEVMKAACNDMDNPLLGSALGRLLLVGRKAPADGITQRQYDAGAYFGWLYRVNAKVRGWPSPNARAIDYGATAPGLSVHAEDSDQYIADIKRKWGDMYGMVMECDGRQGRVFEALKRTLLEDLGPMDEYAVGDLRMGLNAIDRARGA